MCTGTVSHHVKHMIIILLLFQLGIGGVIYDGYTCTRSELVGYNIQTQIEWREIPGTKLCV